MRSYSIPPDIASMRGAVAAYTRSRPADDPQLIETRRSLAALNLERYVARVVAEAPPLTPEQRDRIAALLRPTGGASA